MSNSIKLLIIAFIAAIVLTGFIGEKDQLFGPGKIESSQTQNETTEEPVIIYEDVLTESILTEEVWVSPEYLEELDYNSRENRY